MNKSVLLFLCALALALAPAAAPLGRAQPAPAPAPAAPEPTPTEPADEAPPPAADAAEDDEPKLRELGVDAPAAEVTPAPAPAEAKPEKPAPPARKEIARKPGRGSSGHDGPPFGSHTVPAGKTQGEAVSLFGDTTVDGEVTDAAVSVLGNTTVNGKVGDAAVSVLGTTTVNGHVGGEVVAVLGDVILGPDAQVDGEVVAVLGKVVRGDNSVVKGGVQQIGGFGPFGGVEWLRAYVTKCLIWGRPLAIGEHLGWAWFVAGGFLLFYLLLALIFPRGVEKAAEVLEERPGGTLLAALLTVLLAPILIILLALTGVGVVFLPFLGVGLLCASFFGRAAVLAWFGRRVLAVFGRADATHPVLAVLLGGVLVLPLYLIPFLGGLLYTLFGLLGLGMIAHRIVLAARREKPATASRPPFAPAPPPVPAPAAPAAPAASAENPFTVPAAPASDSVFGAAPGLVPPPVSGLASAPVPPAVPPPVPAALPSFAAATLPRAGFWIRLAASALDAVLVVLAVAFLSHVPLLGRLVGDFFPLWYAAYCVAFWQWRGTTIGGVICGLKVVRLDDRPIDWGIATVRGLGGFLSAVVAGLGFIWVSFDDERQSWHDKIAGTTVVKVPKGTPLL